MANRSRLRPEQIEKLLGHCYGCAHSSGAKFPGKPGTGKICTMCTRSRVAEPDASLISDQGVVAYGTRDCYIAKDRLDMELRGETFFNGGGKRKDAAEAEPGVESAPESPVSEPGDSDQVED